MNYDPKKVSTDQLLRSYRFHDQDTGCQTVEQEVRRMWLIDVIAEELEARGTEIPQYS